MIWRALEVLEERSDKDSGLGKSMSAVAEDRQEMITVLTREIFYCSPALSLNHRLAAAKLLGFLCASPPSLSVLEEKVSVYRDVLHTRHYVREGEDLADLLRALEALCQCSDLRYLTLALEERASLMRQALVLSHADKHLITSLANVLSMLYDCSSRQEHLQEAQQLAEEMRQRKTGLDCAVLSTMEKHLNETGSLPDIDTWLKLHCRITTLAPTTHVDCPERLMTLETAMREQGSSARDRIEVLKEAERLTSLGFGVSSRLKVLNELVCQCRTIGTEDASQEASRLTKAAQSLIRGSWHTVRKLTEFTRKKPPHPFDRPHDKSRTSSLYSAALAFDATAQPMRHALPQLLWVNPFRAEHRMLSNPAGKMEDYASAFRREALALGDIATMEHGSQERAHACVAHALALVATNRLDLLDQAVGLCWEALRGFGYGPELSVPVSGSLRRALSAFSHASYMRYTHFGALLDLEQSVSALKICLAGVTGPERFAFYNSLSMSLEARFRRLGQQEDILLAVEACRAFLAESGIHDQIIQMIVFWRLSKALVAYHDATGDGEVLDKAAGVGRDATAIAKHVSSGPRRASEHRGLDAGSAAAGGFCVSERVPHGRGVCRAERVDEPGGCAAGDGVQVDRGDDVFYRGRRRSGGGEGGVQVHVPRRRSACTVV